MEPTAAWVPFNVQLSNWTMEYAGWDPGYPVESESTEMVEFEYAAATDDDSVDKADQQEFEPHFHNMGMKIPINPIHVFEDAAREFKVDIDMMKMKIHKYPPSIQVFDNKFFTVPRLVAIGPYHHGQNQLKQAEKAKYVAAYHCIMESGHSVQDMYDAVVTAAYDSRSLYDKDVMADISEDDFLHMMFYDACFLVQYFALSTNGSSTMDPSLRGFFDFNRKAIRHDIVLLENQIPWRVVEAVLRFRPVDLKAFVAFWKKYLQDRKVVVEKPLVLDDSFEPPHLLGLLRFYIVGKGNTKTPIEVKTNTISFSVSAIELAENGIKLKANEEETTELIHMGVNKRGIFAELFMAPLSLDDERASFLINMAALELCTTSNFQEAEPEESAVCSYLLLLSLLVHREEDVQELRTKHLLQGGAGLVNKDALTFFTRLQSLPLRGSNCYVRIMMEIEKYKVNRQMQIKVHAFFYKNKRTIFAIFSVVGVLVSILGTLMSLKKRSMV
ncbi:hypothetical protein BDA96_05G232200 [Sorghum bicolor]|uniref:Uncharacterized protein n=1 Tax=Sorghum bicolor TaxID=4558 RepID=A0A921UGL2_SORBI|nr:hypothetical protein BDA96_05G232200 [Sorghum bicolor]